jgi:hypothetical protein
MTDGRRRRTSPRARGAPGSQGAHDEDVERALGRGVAIGLPTVTLLGAVVAGLVASAGSALLILASGVLLGAIAFFWASVRTLSGDAPLATDFESLAAHRHGVDALVEQKGRLLRTLRDLESEHDIGKIDDADYAALVTRTRDEAKTVMREMDVQVAPLRDEAERLAREYLKKRGLVAGEARAGDDTPRPAVEPGKPPDRIACTACGASNEADATFCKQCGAPVKEPGRAAT